MIPIIYNPNHSLYMPELEILSGKITQPHEIPERIESIKTEIEKIEHTILFEVNDKCSKNLLSLVHKTDYIDFLEQISQRLSNDQYFIPDTFFVRNVHTQKPTNIKEQSGFYCFDTFTPFSRLTFDAASIAANCAIEGAKKLDRHDLVYSLCRPPGHHAQSDLAGGYCFINNAAIAAKFLNEEKYSKLAILDIDFHHGNGTQEIFYESSEIFFVSLHGNPSFYYPYFSGYKKEIGKGKGKGFTMNFPLEVGTTDNTYLNTLDTALGFIKKFNPECIVVSVGFDTYIKDPIGTFHLSNQCYTHIASKIKLLELPVLLIQEGGYRVKSLGNLAKSFLEGFY